MSITKDDNIEGKNPREGEENNFNEADQALIPDHRSFNLYLMLISGLIVYGLALYLYFYPGVNDGNIYFDGERFVEGKLTWQILCYVGTIISAFPAYHLLKGSHKVKQKEGSNTTTHK